MKRIPTVIADFCEALKAFNTTTADGKKNFAMILFKALFVVIGALAIVVYSAVALVVGLLKAIWHFIAGTHGFQWITDFAANHPRIFRYTNTAFTATVVVLLIIGINGISFNLPTNRPKDLKSYQNATISACNGKDELKGVDISAWQADTYQKFTAGESDFVLVRIANGKNVDPYCDLIYQNAKANTKLLGGYFYAANDTWQSYIPEEYAEWCAQTVEGYIGWTAFFLDIESLDASNYVNVEWAERWLDAWYEITGIRAGLYMNQNCADLNSWPESIIQNTPLWCANYNGTPALKDDWNVIMHQTTDVPVDTDKFFGSAKDWWKLCEKR